MKRIVLFFTMMLIACSIVACEPEEHKHSHFHQPELYAFNVKYQDNTIFYTDGSLWTQHGGRSLYVYDLNEKSESETLLIENVNVFEVTSDYVFYIEYSLTDPELIQHQVSEFGDEIRNYSKISRIYRFDRKTNKSELFTSVSNLQNFYVHDKWLYVISGDIYDIDSEKVRGNPKVCAEYRIERFDINDAEVVETVFSEYYVEYKYQEYFESKLNNFTLLSEAESLVSKKNWFTNLDNYDFNISKIVGDKLYFVYPYVRKNSSTTQQMIVAALDLTTKTHKECVVVPATQISGLDITEDSICVLYYSEKRFQAMFDFDGQNAKLRCIDVPVKKRNDNVFDSNSNVFYSIGSTLWYFDSDNKLHIVSECADNIIHEKYDFGIHPKIIYATEDFIVFEDFAGKDKTIRMEVVYKDGSSLRIPVEFKGFPGEVVG